MGNLFALFVKLVFSDIFAVLGRNVLAVDKIVLNGFSVRVGHVLNPDGRTVYVNDISVFVAYVLLFGRSVGVKQRIRAFACRNVLNLVPDFELNLFEAVIAVVFDKAAFDVVYKHQFPFAVHEYVFKLVALGVNRSEFVLAEAPVAAVGVGKFDNEFVFARLGELVFVVRYKFSVLFFESAEPFGNRLALGDILLFAGIFEVLDKLFEFGNIYTVKSCGKNPELNRLGSTVDERLRIRYRRVGGEFD